ncbi:MAG TPA: hypothetical protein VHY35_17875 [Stellaceae bacterium]|nr:hypothetical protein [Stellaceae bacterium]
MTEENTTAPRPAPWTAKEALACAICWAGFIKSENRQDTPEQYWLGLSEQARNSYRRTVREEGLLALVRGQAIVLPHATNFTEAQWTAFGAEVGLKQRWRMTQIVNALHGALFKERRRAAAAVEGEGADG